MQEALQLRTQQFNPLTRTLARMCHGCPICPAADRRPDSAFGKLMRWHRTWCPAYVAHVKVYGRKELSV